MLSKLVQRKSRYVLERYKDRIPVGLPAILTDREITKALALAVAYFNCNFSIVLDEIGIIIKHFRTIIGIRDRNFPSEHGLWFETSSKARMSAFAEL
jgi:hypothetical protein